MYEIKPFPYDGTIDADGHLLEPDWLWDHYLDPAFRDRSMGIFPDEQGLEYLQIDGRPSERTTKGVISLMGAMGEDDPRPSPGRRYMDSIPYGAGDPNERLALLDKEHLDGVLLYGTVELLWECELTDPELTLAYCRAYNRWIADFCRDSAGRLSAVAHLSLLDPAGAAAELRRAVADGCVGAWVAPFTHTRKAHGHPDHDVLWQTATELGVPVAVHPTYEPMWCTPIRFDGFGRASEFHYNVMLRQGSQQALLSFFTHGTLERFPDLQLGVLESGMGWVGSFLDRADAVFETISSRGLPLTTRPSELFARQCFISGDPDETAAPLTMDHVGAQCFMWATDYPHPDHPGTWVDSLTDLVQPLSEETRAKFLGDNVRRIYGLTI
jgi:predicted TIM-barrel fold metal-dependent hydrolase